MHRPFFPGRMVGRSVVGHYAVTTGFGSGCRNGRYRNHRQSLLHRPYAGKEVPHVPTGRVGSAKGDGLSGIDRTAAANGNNDFQSIVTYQSNAFFDLGQTRIALHARQFTYSYTRLLHQMYAACKQAIFLQRTRLLNQ